LAAFAEWLAVNQGRADRNLSLAIGSPVNMIL
jgi:hypothetical protein